MRHFWMLTTTILLISLHFDRTGHLAVPPAQASLLVEMSVAELVQGSKLVVAATPLEAYSVWENRDQNGGQRIVTYTHVRVDQVLDGTKPKNDVWVRTLGGRVGHVGQHVDAEAELTPFESAVLFLNQREDGTHTVTGMSQGRFLLTSQAPGGPAFLHPSVALQALVARAESAPAQVSARDALTGKTLAEAIAVIGRERGLAH